LSFVFASFGLVVAGSACFDTSKQDLPSYLSSILEALLVALPLALLLVASCCLFPLVAWLLEEAVLLRNYLHWLFD